MPAAIELVSSRKGELEQYDRRLLDVVKGALKSDLSEASREMYESDWGQFTSFCSHRGVRSLPAEEGTLCLFFADLRLNGIQLSTMRKMLSGIRYYHDQSGKPLDGLPMVAKMLSGFAREMNTAPKQRKPLLPEHIEKIAAGMNLDELIELRNLAIILVGFSGALRRGEIMALQVKDVEFVDQGMDITVSKRKNRQKGMPFRVAVPNQDSELCPVKVLRRWLKRSGLKDGPLFRPVRGDKIYERQMKGRQVLRIVQACVAKLGFKPGEFGGHSLRAGLMTAAANSGMKLEKIVETSDHKSLQVAMGYIRNAERFDRAASGGHFERPQLKEKARQLARERGVSSEEIRAAFLMALKTDISVTVIEQWISQKM